MKNYDARITALVNDFVAALTALAREAARDSIDAALVGALGSGAARAPRAAGKRGASGLGRAVRPKGAKRSPAELVQLQDRMIEFIGKHPGLRIEQINRELGTNTADLALPLRKLVADGVLRTEGSRRATKYFPGSGQRRQAAKRGRKKKS
ncbi:MAG: hypothetical protein R2939_15865 [Kofleriaceae bacterium]